MPEHDSDDDSNENVPQSLIGSGTVKRITLVGVGVAFLKDVCLWPSVSLSPCYLKIQM